MGVQEGQFYLWSAYLEGQAGKSGPRADIDQFCFWGKGNSGKAGQGVEEVFYDYLFGFFNGGQVYSSVPVQKKILIKEEFLNLGFI